MKENDDEIRLKQSEIDSLNKEIDRLRQLLQMQQSDAGISGHGSSVGKVSTVFMIRYIQNTKHYKNCSMPNDRIHEYHTYLCDM